MKSLAMVCAWLWLAGDTEVAGGRRKLVEKSQKYADPVEDGESINVCNLGDYPDMNMHCVCDSQQPQNATSAECWLFNRIEAEQSPMWDEFRSQPHLNRLSIYVRSNLTFVPSRTLSHLPHLTYFSLQYGAVQVLSPYALANSSSLQMVDLRHNGIRSLEKYSITNLASLEEINFGNNEIQEIGRDMFRNLPALKRLYLDSNEIHVVQDLAFAELQELRELEMFRNKITAISRNTFAGLQSLRRLDLHSNLLAELKDFTFAEMPNLEELIIEQNAIESVGEKVFYGVKHLRRLILAENKLQILPDDIFISLPHLRTLDLRDNLLQTFTYNTAAPILDKLKNESFYFLIESNRLECDCNLSWLRTLANETASKELSAKLKQLSCYMKDNYYSADSDPELNANGLADSRLLRDGVIDSDTRQHHNEPDGRMLKLFSIPSESLPCPEKRQANEMLLEQMSKSDPNAAAASKSLVVKTFSVIIYSVTLILSAETFVL